MSGETENSVSGWTVDTLHAHMTGQMDDLRAMLQERYATQTKAVDAAFQAQQLAMQTAMTAAETAVGKALESAEKAVGKAEIAAEKRFDAVNEFRAQLADQAQTFLPRQEYEAAMRRLDERLKELADIAASHVTRVEWDAGHGRLSEQVREIADTQNRAAGKGLGQAATWGVIIAVIASVGALISIWVALNHL